MSTLGKAVILFGADTAQFRTDVGKAVAVFERGMGQMAAAMRGLDGPMSRLGAGLSLAGATALAKSAINAGDEIGKLSQKIGIGTEALSSWRLAADLGDVSAEQFGKGLKEFSKSLVEGSNESSKAGKVLKALGVDVRNGPELAFRQFAESIAKLEGAELKLAASSVIMGKAGADWIPVLNAGARGLVDAEIKARGLGIMISEDFAKKSEQFNDNMKIVAESSRAFGITLANHVLPQLAEMSKRLADAATKGGVAKGVLEELARVSELPQGNALMSGNFLLGLYGASVEAFRARGAAKESPRMLGFQSEVRAVDNAMLGQAPDPEAVRKAVAETDALNKRMAAALEQMEGKKQALLHLNEEELMLERVLTGSYKEFNAETKVKLLNLALELDARKQLAERIAADLQLGLAETAAREQAGEILREQYLATKLSAEHLAFEADMIGRTGGEQERLNAIRQIDLDLLERKRRIGQTFGEDVAGAMVAVARAEQEAARARAAVDEGLRNRQLRERGELVRQNVEAIRFETSTLGMGRRELEKLHAIRGLEVQQYGRVLTEQERSILLTERDIQLRRELIGVIEERQRVERDWQTGARQGLEEYADAASNMAAMTRDAFLSSFRSMEDALVDFVKTGKLNFRGLADSIISDLIRIAVRKSITGPLAEGIGGALGGLFGGGSSAAGSAGAGDLTALAFSFAAKGGVMTSGGMIPLARYERGGVASSPQMAIFGEGSMNEAFVPLPDGRRIPVDLNDAGGGARIINNIQIDATGADSAAIARLHRALAELSGSIEYRALAATANAMGRGGAYRHRMRK